MSRWTLPDVLLLVQYTLAAFGKVPVWHCIPTVMFVVFVYLYEQGEKTRREAKDDAKALARRSLPPTVQPRHTRSHDSH